jgi:lipoyl(octanoyl) transferase
MNLRWQWLGRVPYGAAAALQEELRARVLAGDATAERLLFLEHDPVITLGRSANPAHVLATPPGVEVVRSTRGGDVTVHGPGQLVIYPVVRLPRGVVAFVTAVGSAIAGDLAARGVAAEWRRDPAGVWVGDAKIAACGLHIHRRVATHGFALNVTAAALELFRLIVPCGIAGGAVTALERHAPAPALPALAAALARRIAPAIGRSLEVEEM